LVKPGSNCSMVVGMSNTTKSRLNAILSEHGIPGEGIFQKNYQWFFKSNDYGVIPFFSGMRIA